MNTLSILNFHRDKVESKINFRGNIVSFSIVRHRGSGLDFRSFISPKSTTKRVILPVFRICVGSTEDEFDLLFVLIAERDVLGKYCLQSRTSKILKR